MTNRPTNVRRVLITGSSGYIGSVLCPRLVQAGYDVVGVDVGWYDDDLLFPRAGTPPTLRADIRDLEPSHLTGLDSIVHLAALSNDPLGAIDASLTHEINHHATVRLAEMAADAGVSRFIYSSSCSVYGAAGDEPLDETASLAPQTAYAISKVNAERDLLTMSSPEFAVTSLRNATAFGISPSQRFDIVVPNLAGSAWVHGELRLLSDGTPWRPLVHILDIAHAIECSIAGPADAPAGQVFNVGRIGANYQVRDIARAVQAGHPDNPPLNISPKASPDSRTYLVDFRAIHEHLPGFNARWSLEQGVHECFDAFERIDLNAARFQAPAFTRLREIKRLLVAGDLTDDLRWTRPRANVHELSLAGAES